MDRFTQATAVAIVGVVLVALFGACEDEYVCPQGSASQRGRCRLLPVDGAGADAFTWPPADAAAEIGEPPAIGSDALSDASPDASSDASGDGLGPADGGAEDGAAAEDVPPASDAAVDATPGETGADTP